MTVSRRASTPYCAIYGRRDKLASRRGIIYCPGGIVGTEMSWQTGGDPIRSHFEYLTQVGHRIVTIDDQVQWGNATHLTRMDSMYTTAQSTFGFDASKVNLFASSGGAAPILNWAKANPTKVQSIALILPAVDIIDIDVNNRVSVLGFDPVTQGPRSAYGGSTPPVGSNPASNAASFAGIPIKMWYSGNDTVVIPSTVTTFAATAGATTVNMGNLGHAASLAAVSVDDIRQFFNSNG